MHDQQQIINHVYEWLYNPQKIKNDLNTCQIQMKEISKTDKIFFASGS